MSSHFIKQLKIIVLGVILSFGFSYVSAVWAQISVNQQISGPVPPTENAPTPLNVGNYDPETKLSEQVKTGKLTITQNISNFPNPPYPTVFYVLKGITSVAKLNVVSSASVLGNTQVLNGDVKVGSLVNSSSGNSKEVCADKNGKLALCQ